MQSPSAALSSAPLLVRASASPRARFSAGRSESIVVQQLQEPVDREGRRRGLLRLPSRPRTDVHLPPIKVRATSRSTSTSGARRSRPPSLCVLWILSIVDSSFENLILVFLTDFSGVPQSRFPDLQQKKLDQVSNTNKLFGKAPRTRISH